MSEVPQYQTKVIQWFPGHMAKAKKLIRECLPSVDLVIEILDARAPRASQNPELPSLVAGKPLLSVLNKASLADPLATPLWEAALRPSRDGCVSADCITGAGIAEIRAAVNAILGEKLERYQAKGMAGRAVKAMVAGIPNVGKSAFINRMAGAKKAKTEDRPGVTRANQWVSAGAGLDLLDTPGVLWPKFEDKETAENLALTGAIKDEVLDTEEIALILCRRLKSFYPELLAARYKLGEDWREMEEHELFAYIGRKRGFLVSGGEIDAARTAAVLLDEFRGGKIGRITLEKP